MKKQYRATIIISIFGGLLDYSGDWHATKADAKNDAMKVAESKLPAGIYSIGTRFEERNVA